MQNCFRRSEFELRSPSNDLKFHLGRPRPGGSAPFLRAEPEEDDEAARRARRRRFSGGRLGVAEPPPGRLMLTAIG
eukprot:13413568-Alexandrium_andersonii.AAC.1